MLKIEATLNRLSIVTDHQFKSIAEKCRAAFEAGLLKPHTRYFLNPHSCVFIEHDGTYLRTFRMRDNGNGYHDLALYSLPNFEDIGQTFPADSTRGQHRDIVLPRLVA